MRLGKELDSKKAVGKRWTERFSELISVAY
jgi:hypothetical protein